MDHFSSVLSIIDFSEEKFCGDENFFPLQIIFRKQFLKWRTPWNAKTNTDFKHFLDKSLKLEKLCNKKLYTS